MKMLDPKNVVQKSNKMMEVHLKMFEKYFGKYEPCGEQYYFFNDDTQALIIDYRQDKKMLTKVFSISVKVILKNIDMDASWKLKSCFMGNMRAQGMYFKAMDKGSREAERLINSNTAEVNQIFQQTQDVDLQNLIIDYKKDTKMLTATINPYAGAFVWIKLPPVYHDIRLRENEIEAICNIADNAKSLLVKTAEEGIIYKTS